MPPRGGYRPLGLRQLLSRLFKIRPKSFPSQHNITPNGYTDYAPQDPTDWCLLPVTNRPALSGVQLDDLAGCVS